MMRAFLILLAGFAAGWGVAYGIFARRAGSETVSPVTQVVETALRPLDRYTIDALASRTPAGGMIVFDEAVATTSAYTAYRFRFPSDGKTVTGLAHVPAAAVESISSVTQNRQENGAGRTPGVSLPVIVQLRGYVDRSIYAPGVGTRRSAEKFAEAGFLSLAPDFLGYGGSDHPSENVFEERFQTYTVVLDLLASVGTVPFADPGRVGLWGHSNGGHIALAVLEITGKQYPAALWAPVSQSFPYSILYYSHEAPDRGKALRQKLAQFEALYDTELYSVPNYFHRITARMQIHQGTGDDAVPVGWSHALDSRLTSLGIAHDYFVYTGADHNLMPAWDTVVGRDVEFFDKHL